MFLMALYNGFVTEAQLCVYGAQMSIIVCCFFVFNLIKLKTWTGCYVVRKRHGYFGYRVNSLFNSADFDLFSLAHC